VQDKRVIPSSSAVRTSSLYDNLSRQVILPVMNDDFSADISWDELFWALQSKTAQTVLQKVPRSTLEYLHNPENKEKIIVSAQQSLEKTKGEQVTWVEAEILVKTMQEVAKKIMTNQV